MTLRAQIVDGRGTGKTACIFPDQAIYVAATGLPPYSLNMVARPYRQHLTDDGLPTDGTNQAMDVDGSSTNVDFFVEAKDDRDLYITTLSFVIADASQSLNEFANTNAALTNGCRLFYDDDQGEVDIHDALKTNFQFVRLCVGQPAFGDAAGAFLANNVTGTSEGYIPVLSFSQVFGLPHGIKLSAGSNERITMRIRDDCTAADQFDVIAYGFERLKD